MCLRNTERDGQMLNRILRCVTTTGCVERYAFVTYTKLCILSFVSFCIIFWCKMQPCFNPSLIFKLLPPIYLKWYTAICQLLKSFKISPTMYTVAHKGHYCIFHIPKSHKDWQICSDLPMLNRILRCATTQKIKNWHFLSGKKGIFSTV